MSTTDLASHAHWLDPQPGSTDSRGATASADYRWLRAARRSRERRAEARRARRRFRARRTCAVLAAVSLTFAAGGAVAANKTGGASAAAGVQRAGSTVAALQRALGIPADGVYGPQTRRAVRRFQRSRGLTVDGIAGPQTLAALGLGGAARAKTGSGATKVSAPNRTLARIALCESGGDPTAVSANGRYRGKYQFSRATWRDLGGVGDPAAAPEAEQDRLAAKLFAARGTAPWPSCA